MFNPRTLAGEDKRIVGFYLADWMTRRGLVGMLRDIRRVQSLVGTEVDQDPRAIPAVGGADGSRQLRANMTAGKVLLIADPEQVSVSDEVRVA